MYFFCCSQQPGLLNALDYREAHLLAYIKRVLRDFLQLLYKKKSNKRISQSTSQGMIMIHILYLLKYNFIVSYLICCHARLQGQNASQHTQKTYSSSIIFILSPFSSFFLIMSTSTYHTSQASAEPLSFYRGRVVLTSHRIPLRDQPWSYSLA